MSTITPAPAPLSLGLLGRIGRLGLAGLLAAAGAAGTATAAPREAFTVVNGVLQRSETGCGTPQVALAPAASLLPPAPAVTLRTIYLNKNGGTYTRGASTDASVNRVHSSIISGPSGSSFTIPPLNTTTFNWPMISACVRAHFQKYAIQIVETEPTSGAYIEAVVGGNGQEAGFGANELFGIASADNFCGVTEKGVAFNFSETHKTVQRRDEELCATIAHEVGHLVALEHEQLPTDLLSYVLIAQSGTKAFVNQVSGCGTAPNAPNPCTCTTSNTNSHARLAQFIGLRDTEMVPPTLNIDAPGDRVPPTFDILATATDNAQMADVVVLIDDVEVGFDSAPDNNVYQVTANRVAEGPHQLSVIARDAAGNMTRKDLSITVAKLATGETCASNDVCSGGLCAMSTDGNFCTQACELKAANTCPADFECSEVSPGTAVCVAAPDSGCGCSSSRSPGAMLLLTLAVSALLFRRRRR